MEQLVKGSWKASVRDNVLQRPLVSTELFENGVEIELGKNYSGSGLGSFGNFREWPTLNLKMSFPPGRPEIMAAFASELQVLIDTFVEKNDLMTFQGIRTKENTRKEVWKEHGLI